MAHLSVIGCGNLTRSDDGVGVIVARRLMQALQARPRANVSIFDAGTNGMEVMFRARGTSQLVIIDASRSGSEPGAIFQVPGEELEQAHEPAYSLHDFRWDHALHAGRKIFGAGFPSDITVFLIEAANLNYGLELSEPVALAVERVVTDIASIIDRHAAANSH